MDYYAEVRNEDILHIVSIEPPLPPFVGLDATRLTIDRGAMIDYVRSALADEFDDFDIDIQIGPASGAYGVHPLTYSQANCGTGVGCQGTIGGSEFFKVDESSGC